MFSAPGGSIYHQNNLRVAAQNQSSADLKKQADANENPASLKDLMTSETIDRQIQWMKDYNRRVADRASQFLTPEQLKSHIAMQEQQAAMQQMGLKMAGEMFGGKSSTAAK